MEEIFLVDIKDTNRYFFIKGLNFDAKTARIVINEDELNRLIKELITVKYLIDEGIDIDINLS